MNTHVPPLEGNLVARPDATTEPSGVPVLLVDDNPSKRLALKAVLTPLGCRIVEADSGVAALRCVMAEDFAVILLDVCMPDLDGFETASLIRQRRQSEMTPIIFVTANQSDEIDDGERYAEGAVDFLSTPVAPDVLRAKISVFVNLFARAQRLAKRAQEVQNSTDQLRLLTDAAPIGIFQTDAEDRYMYTNPRWSEISGIPSEEAAGRSWAAIAASTNHPGAITELPGSAVYPEEVGRRFEIQVPGAASRIVVITSKAIPDGAGADAGWVGTLADVTAEARAETAMANARDEATDALQQKSDFLANMSHEIRTPMNGVLGMTDLLLETGLDERQRDYAQTVRNSGQALLTIIDDILDFSKVEAGRIEIESVVFDLRTIIGDVVGLLASSAHDKGLELAAFVDDAVPMRVTGDPGRARQVLTNLIGNAIKFTRVGDIVIRVGVAEVAGSQAVIRFEVRDTGDGIASDKLATIFQPFVQADTSTTREYGGTGLGLAICSQLVALMGGECGVTSRLGSGSEFWFTIRVGADCATPAPSPPSSDDGLAGVAVLLVDSSAVQRDVVSDHLVDWGMTVSGADSGQAALAALRLAADERRPFSVVLIDRSLPEIDGLELRDAISGDPKLTARLVLMTGVEGAESEVSSSHAKPINPDRLRACLLVAVGSELQRVAPASPGAQRAQRSVEPAARRLLLAEDNLINQKVAFAMLSSAGYSVDTVLNGSEAVQAVAAQDYDAVLMDCQMPVLNGYEATMAIRVQEGSSRHTPIIAVTAGARREDRERCLAAGMDGYLSKPVSKDALLALVAQSMNRAPTGTSPRPGGDPPTEDESVIDAAVLDQLRLLGEPDGDQFVAELVDQFVRDAEPLLTGIREALEADDGEVVARMAHKLKGSASQLGGARLAAACGRLQESAAAGPLSGAKDLLDEVENDYQCVRRALSEQGSFAGQPIAPGL